MKFLHLIILTFTLVSNSTFANKTEEIVIRCERGNGKYTPWLRYINKSDGNSNTVTADYYRKNKSTGKYEWQTQPCLYKEWSSTPKDGKKVTKYVRGVIEGKILSCETETYKPYPKITGKNVFLTDFEKLKKINRLFYVNGELYSEETFSCETLAQKKAKDREVKVKENKDRTYAGIIMDSTQSDNEILSKNPIRFKFASQDTEVAYYNTIDGELVYVGPDLNKNSIIREIVVRPLDKEFATSPASRPYLEKDVRDKILGSIDSKYKLLESDSKDEEFFDVAYKSTYYSKTFRKKYSNKGDEIYVVWRDIDLPLEWQTKFNMTNMYTLNIRYKSKVLVQAEADRAAKKKAAIEKKIDGF